MIHPFSFVLGDGVFDHFPTASVVVLTREMVHVLRDNAKPDIVESASHVQHCLRTIGHAFGLPLTHLDVMQSATKLYKMWVLDEKKRPKAFGLNEQVHLQMMIRHLTQLFDFTSKGRQGDSEATNEHAKLCETAISIFAVLASQNLLEQESWKTLLMALLGVADYLWTSPKNDKGIAGMLSERVGCVLFEVWVMSKIEDPALWSAMERLFPGWCHLMSVVVTWKGVTVALTQRMLNMIYGPTEGLPFVKLTIAPKARIDGNFVYYAWSRYLNLLGNLVESTASPETFLEVFVAVRALVNLFLEVGRESIKMKSGKKQDDSLLTAANAASNASERNFSGVDGNTLLQLFGKFIFDAVISNNPSRHLWTPWFPCSYSCFFVRCFPRALFQRQRRQRHLRRCRRALLCLVHSVFHVVFAGPFQALYVVSRHQQCTG